MLALSGSAFAVVYKWVEEDGKVIYSNAPPPDPSAVRELTRIDDLDIGVLENRGQEPAAEKRNDDTTVATPEPVPGVSREAATLIPREPVTLLPKESPAPPREAEAPPPRVFPRSTHSAAVQDPCLVSPDPKCHEHHKGSYHPYLGYTPPEGPVAQPVGATTSVAGGTAR